MCNENELRQAGKEFGDVLLANIRFKVSLPDFERLPENECTEQLDKKVETDE